MTKRRAWIAFLIFTVVIINYMDRIALSVSAKPIAAEFGFSPIAMGYLFSCFLWTYIVCLIPLGFLVEKIGAKRMVGGGIALWSAATVATAATVGFASILGARLVMGASEATTFPACGRVIRDWFPERERGVVTTLFNGGSTAGPALGAMVTAWLVTSFGWRAAFIVLGLLGFVWLVGWAIYYGSPEVVAWLPAAERNKILNERNGPPTPESKAGLPPSSLLHLLSQRSVWGLIITQACLVYTAYLFLTWLPSYLQSTYALSTMDTGYLTAVPYLLTMILGIVVARISDRTLTSEAIRRGQRRNFIAAMAVLSLTIVLTPAIGSLWQAMIVLTLVLTGSTAGAGLNFTLASDLLRNPSDVSRVIALTAFGGNLFGLIAPIITGYIIAGTGGYTWAFRIAAVLLLCGAFVILLMTRHPIEAEHAPAGTGVSGRRVTV
ncbi:MAG TPA: MFS transporter [Rhodopila sp.]|nr:MFS transporter [Rhodopila sp.]